MRPILGSNDYKVASTCNRKEVMKVLKKRKPGLILLDIMMEKMTDVFDICYKLKYDHDMKKIPMLAVSSTTAKTGLRFSQQTVGEYFEANDFTKKPIAPTAPLARIDKLLKV